MLLSMLLSITVLSQKAEELAGVHESNHDPRILVDTENIHFTLPMQNGFKSFSIKSVTWSYKRAADQLCSAVQRCKEASAIKCFNIHTQEAQGWCWELLQLQGLGANVAAGCSIILMLVI